jgi:hypothetical protein
MVDFQVGDAGSVEFDFFKIKEFLRYEQKGDARINIQNFHFIHVHPPSFGNEASSMDMEVMRGYLKAFGAMPDFSIITFDTDKITDVMGQMNTYMLANGEKSLENLTIAKNRYFVFGTDLCPFLFFLKQASYGYLGGSDV